MEGLKRRREYERIWSSLIPRLSCFHTESSECESLEEKVYLVYLGDVSVCVCIYYCVVLCICIHMKDDNKTTA